MLLAFSGTDHFMDQADYTDHATEESSDRNSLMITPELAFFKKILSLI